MKKAERLLAEKYLLQCISDEDPDFVDKTMAAFDVSRSTVYNYINALQDAKELERVGGSMPYRILYKTTRFTIDPAHDRSEARFFNRDLAPLLAHLPQNVQDIWRYAVTAMVNNALEHAHASAIICAVSRSRLSTIVGVLDNGVGIFRHIQQSVKETTGNLIAPDDAAALLYTGGYTADPDSHAGQGIFFTSRLMDHFAIRSDAQLFTPYEADAEETGGERFRGTAVQMALANDTPRTLTEVMNRYIDPERGFVRTTMPLARFFGGFPVSRSEARRLFEALQNFEAAELDCAGLTALGPDFVHEFFEVLAPRRPEFSAVIINAAPDVAAAVRRAGVTI